MSEDTDAKAGGRRRRTTRAGRRRAAGRVPSEHLEPSSSEPWSPAWSSDPDTVPLEEVEDESEPEVSIIDDVEAEGEGDCAAGQDAAAAEDTEALPTGEIVVTPFSLAELQDEEKTNPRIRVGDMGPLHSAELEPVTGPAVTIWSRPSTRIGADRDESSTMAVRPAVIITPSRVISDHPPPMHSPSVVELTLRKEPAAARAPAAPPAAEPPPSRRAGSADTDTAASELEAAPEPSVQTAFEPFEELLDASEPATAPAAPAPAAPVAPPAVPAAAPAAVPAAAAPAAPAAVPAAAPPPPAPAVVPATPAVSAPPGPAVVAEAGPTTDASADEGSLQIVDVDVAELEHARRSRTPPPPPPPDARKAAPPPAPPAKRPPPPPAPSKGEDDRQKRKQARQWWERFFSEDYLMSVRPATAAQIAKQVDFVEQSLGVGKGGTILDVGCGLGLHAVELTRRGYLVVGLDLSLAMITRAAELAQQQQLKLNVVHADIREMEFDGAFDGVICMGTTFGFFDDDANRDMLARLHQALRPGGRLLLDMVNRDYVIGFQPNLVWFEGDECVCMEESDFNYFNSRLTVKRTMMREDGKQSNAEYSVRLYSLHELGTFMQQVGFRVIEVSGQEAIRGAFFGANSPRVLMLSERRALGRPSAVIPLERNSSAEQSGRPSTALPPERGSAEIPKNPKPD